jgi:hypothetical protein
MAKSTQKALPQATNKAGFTDEPESQALAVRSDEQVQASGGSAAFSEPNFGKDDLAMPRLRLGQGLTPEVVRGEAQIGQWILLGHDPVDKVTVVPMRWGKGMVLQEKDDNAVLCSSNDCVNGEGIYGLKSKENPTGRCQGCPMNVWTDGKQGKRVPPKCTQFYTYGVWSITHQAMALMELRKTAVNTAKQINSVIMQRKMGNFAIELVGDQQTSGKNSFQVPKFRVVPAEDDDLQMARSMFNV